MRIFVDGEEAAPFGGGRGFSREVAEEVATSLRSHYIPGVTVEEEVEDGTDGTTVEDV